MRSGGRIPIRARLLFAAKEWGVAPWTIPEHPGWLRWLRERELIFGFELPPDPMPDDFGDEDDDL